MFFKSVNLSLFKAIQYNYDQRSCHSVPGICTHGNLFDIPMNYDTSLFGKMKAYVQQANTLLKQNQRGQDQTKLLKN